MQTHERGGNAFSCRDGANAHFTELRLPSVGAMNGMCLTDVNDLDGTSRFG